MNSVPPGQSGVKEMYPDLGANKQRIKTACLSCRRRKSKCDGNHICSACLYHQRECVYPQPTITRRRGKGKTNSKKELSHINERINALENLLVRLSDSLTQKPVPPNENDNSELPISATDSEKSEYLETVKEIKSVEPKSGFFGAHCAIAIFSSSSILWLRGKIKNDKLLAPLEKIPLLVGTALKCASQHWTNPVSLEDVLQCGRSGYFPFEYDLVEEVFEAYGGLFLFSFFTDQHQLKELFNSYYEGNHHQFAYSELVLMNMYIAVSLRLRLDGEHDQQFRSRYTKLSKLNDDELYELQESCFNSAVCYYSRVSVTNEGIATFQSLSLMILYVVSYYVSDFQIMTMLSSVLIRFAKEMELSKGVYSADGNKEDEYYSYRRIWWFCQYIDIVACYKTGNPPMILNQDTSSISTLNEEFQEVGLTFPDTGFYPIPEEVDPKFQLAPYHAYTLYISLRLKKIKRETFNELFSIKAQIENNNTNLFYERIEGFNSSMNELAELMDPKIRLLPPSRRHEFKDNRTVIGDFGVFFMFLERIDYYAHYILVNRTPIFQRVEKDERFKKHLEISAEYARTGLDLLNSVHDKGWSKLMKSDTLDYSISIYSALLTHCILNPFGEQTLDDCQSLIEYVTKSSVGNEDFVKLDCNTNYEEKMSFSFLFLRVSLKLMIKILGNELNRDLTREFKLEQVFESVESHFPDFFEAVNETKDVKHMIHQHLLNPNETSKKPKQTIIRDLIISLEHSEECKDAHSEFPAFLISQFINLPSCFQEY